MSKLQEAVERIRADAGAKDAPASDWASDATPPAPKRGRGRPPGAKNKPKPAETPKPYVPTETSIRACAALGATVWKLISTFAPIRGLNEDEAMELGTALDPIVWKYLPMIADWQAEINLAVVVVGLIGATRIERKPKAEEQAAQPTDSSIERHEP